MCSVVQSLPGAVQCTLLHFTLQQCSDCLAVQGCQAEGEIHISTDIADNARKGMLGKCCHWLTKGGVWVWQKICHWLTKVCYTRTILYSSHHLPKGNIYSDEFRFSQTLKRAWWNQGRVVHLVFFLVLWYKWYCNSIANNFIFLKISHPHWQPSKPFNKFKLYTEPCPPLLAGGVLEGQV